MPAERPRCGQSPGFRLKAASLLCLPDPFPPSGRGLLPAPCPRLCSCSVVFSDQTSCSSLWWQGLSFHSLWNWGAWARCWELQSPGLYRAVGAGGLGRCHLQRGQEAAGRAAGRVLVSCCQGSDGRDVGTPGGRRRKGFGEGSGACSEKAVAPTQRPLLPETPWAEEPRGLQSTGSLQSWDTH